VEKEAEKIWQINQKNICLFHTVDVDVAGAVVNVAGEVVDVANAVVNVAGEVVDVTKAVVNFADADVDVADAVVNVAAVVVDVAGEVVTAQPKACTIKLFTIVIVNQGQCYKTFYSRNLQML